MSRHEEQTTCEAHLRRVLTDLRDKHCDGFTTRLVAEIADANGRNADGPPVDRKKLADLLDEPGRRIPVRFSLAELEAIGRFLARHGRRLGDLFDQRSILESLGEPPGKVTCLLGAQEHTLNDRTRLAVGAWDTRSLHVLLSAMGRLPAHVQVDLQEVLWSNKKRPTEEQFQKEDWYRCLAEGGPSVVCIGSPKVNHATELVLAKILGTVPFRRPTGKPNPRGVYFIWPPEEHPLPSAFSLPASAIREMNPELADLADTIEHGKASALLFKGKLYPTHPFGEQNPTYGLIAAQRRSGGATWVCIAGLSGPSSYAAALRAVTAPHPMPPALPGRPSEALVIGVMAKGKHDERPVDPRVVTDHAWLEDTA
jgi:hypothetical protein